MAVRDVEDPRIEHPNDVIVRVTSSAICGSDLPMYEGRTAAEPGIVFGHENLGVVEETGPGVVTLSKGDRVVMPFNVACGFCKNCLAGDTGFCLTVNPGFAGGAYGYVAMGPYTGGQAERLRVPFADFNCLKLPAGEEKDDAVRQILDRTGGEGTDKGIDAVGYQAQGREAGHEEPAVVLNSLVDTVRPTGRLGVPGLYVPSDPGAPDEHAKRGQLLVSIGRMFEKGQRMGTGQCNVKRYNRQLRDLIIAGRARPSFVVSHELPLAQAPQAYEKFDKRVEGYTKVVLHPVLAA